MKKAIALMTMLCASILFADSYAVYNFKASLKRIEPVLTIQKAPGVNSRHISYKVVSDIISGYIVLPECCDAIESGACVACGGVNTFGNNELGEPVTYLYIIRKGEKLEKDKLIKMRADYIFASVFGQGYNSAYIGSTAENDVFKKLVKSSFAMQCTFPENMFESRFYNTGTATNGMRKLDYGMLGFTCLDGTVFFTGYGSATPIVKTVEDVGFCYSNVSSVKCVRVISASGSLTGVFNYSNPAICETCDEWALVDPCSYYEPNYKSPVSGTWMIKYNSSLSGKKFETLDEVDEYLLKASKKHELIDCEELSE